MPKEFSRAYTVTFTTGIAVVSALLLSLAATALKPRQDRNAELDAKRNILKALRVEELGTHPSEQQVLDFFNDRIEGVVVDYHGQKVDGIVAARVDPEAEEKEKPVEQRHFPVFVLKDATGKPGAYCIPLLGKGLWSTLYGYLALESDLNRVRGITFYKHGETPGLGAEIAEPWFQANFQDGKKILDEKGQLVAIAVLKGMVDAKYPRADDPARAHAVDGISGATLTGNGVNALLKKDLGHYEPYFRQVRKPN